MNSRNGLNDHVDSVESELDWLHDQLHGSGLEIDPQTLMGVSVSHHENYGPSVRPEGQSVPINLPIKQQSVQATPSIYDEQDVQNENYDEYDEELQEHNNEIIMSQLYSMMNTKVIDSDSAPNRCSLTKVHSPPQIAFFNDG